MLAIHRGDTRQIVFTIGRAGMLCAVPLLAASFSLSAQRIQTRVPSSTIPTGLDPQGNSSNTPVSDDNPSPRAKLRAKTCRLQPFQGMENTVSVSALRVPPKAQSEYEKACEALRDQKPQVEEHLRKATQLYPGYAEAWATLGKLVESQGKVAEAKSDCGHSVEADAAYWPAYLCLAEIAGRDADWSEALAKASRAVELNGAAKSYGYMLEAVALYNLNRLDEAEDRAHEAELLDQNHQEPMLQFLMARIYEAEGDETNAVVQLREFLQYAKDSPESNSAKQDLARLEAENGPER
jgi:Flp pilus assembly protein TadD